MADDPNTYLNEMRRLQNKAIEEALEQYGLQKEYTNKQAESALKEANRASASNYMKYINPYGVQSENLAKAGLNYSGIAETNFAKGYNAYQNALSKAASQTQSAKDEANQAYLGAVSKANSDKLNVEADYYNNLYNNFWNKKQLDYYYNQLNKA